MIEEFPLTSVDEFYTGEILELARAEAGLRGDAIDERHMLIALALLLFEGSPPPASALRYLTGLSRVEDTSYGRSSRQVRGVGQGCRGLAWRGPRALPLSHRRAAALRSRIGASARYEPR